MIFTFNGSSIEVRAPPAGLESKFAQLFNTDALEFLTALISHFQPKATELIRARKLRKISLDINSSLPAFQSTCNSVREGAWKISPLPAALQNRRIDLGDVAPANSVHFKASLASGAQGVQVDFDDGECPTWANMIQGLHNVIAFTQGTFYPGEVPNLEKAPILMLRPRAWNMPEHNILVNGRQIPGPLMDYGLLMFHIGKVLADREVGPYFYLSKVEASTEALLWNDIFIWTQLKLGILRGTIKACVLIENILAAFEMDEILYELREHSLGLNCGIWDYAASIVNKFGDRKEFILPDRNVYVNISNHYLLCYIRLVVKTCHRRGAPATGGMAALTTRSAKNEIDKKRTTDLVVEAKLKEIREGLDGFLLYDSVLIPHMNGLWQNLGINQISTILHQDLIVETMDLLYIPKGKVTSIGIQRNVKVGVYFLYSWLGNSRGHFELDGGIEDSATAEISRSQIWQYIYHQVDISDKADQKVTRAYIEGEVEKIFTESDTIDYKKDIMELCGQLFLELVTASEFPEFITSYLYNHSVFRKIHAT